MSSPSIISIVSILFRRLIVSEALLPALISIRTSGKSFTFPANPFLLLRAPSQVLRLKLFDLSSASSGLFEVKNHSAKLNRPLSQGPLGRLQPLEDHIPIPSGELVVVFDAVGLLDSPELAELSLQPLIPPLPGNASDVQPPHQDLLPELG